MYTTMAASDNNDRIEVITEVQRSRRWTAPEKLALVQRTFEPGQSVSLVARQADISPNQLFQWKRVKQLEATLGRRPLENESLKEAVDYGKSRK